MNNIKLIHGDCLDKLKELDDNSVDSIVTDPPYMIGFMGKDWDKGDDNIAGKTELWKECLRVLKPGGHLLSFGATRTYHRMTIAIEDTGFEIRDCIFWCYGSGFPKSLNIGKAVDKIQGNEREVVGEKTGGAYSSGTNNLGIKHIVKDGQDGRKTLPTRGDDFGKITKGNSAYEGWGTALKPAVEPVVMARKPFKGSVAENVLEWGTGGINIDESRIETDDNLGRSLTEPKGWKNTSKLNGSINDDWKKGRWPANLILDEEAGKMLDEQSGLDRGQKGIVSGNEPSHTKKKAIYGDYSMVDGKYREPMDSGGGASRFFYCPKVSVKERNEGVGERNTHPTVKPTDLMLYLIRLVTPKGGTTLDPFMGSGSTGKAAVRGGFDFIGIERERDYMEIAESRINWEMNKPKNKTKSKTKTQIDPNTDDTPTKFWE